MSSSLLRFSKSFMVSNLTFESLIHFEFHQHSLHKAIQFSQHHLLKRLFLPHCTFLALLLQINCPCMWWAYFQALYYIPFICVSLLFPVSQCLDHYSFVIQFEIRKHAPPFFFLPFFFWLCSWHVEALGPGVKPEPQQ